MSVPQLKMTLTMAEPRVVEERMATLRTLAAEKSETHRRCFVGRDIEAITLNTPSDLRAQGATAALSGNFLPVEINAALPANELVIVRVSALSSDGTLRADPSNPPFGPGPIRAFHLSESPA